jgi:hypothetical protein
MGARSFPVAMSPVDVMRPTPETGARWWRHNAPIIRHYVEPGTPGFDEVFGATRDAAERIAPVAAPRAWYDRTSHPANLRMRRYHLSDGKHLQVRISDDEGRHVGVLWLWRGTLRDSVLWRLARGDEGLFERMDRVVEPARRLAGILFADLEASGDLARRLSSRGYFELIRELTDLIDASVIAHDGIVGKHAGDGGSALFLAEDFAGSESAAARATIDAARAIRDGAEHLGPRDVRVTLNVGVHWGATLMVGQVATRGRLEVTALGDPRRGGDPRHRDLTTAQTRIVGVGLGTRMVLCHGLLDRFGRTASVDDATARTGRGSSTRGRAPAMALIRAQPRECLALRARRAGQASRARRAGGNLPRPRRHPHDVARGAA